MGLPYVEFITFLLGLFSNLTYKKLTTEAFSDMPVKKDVIKSKEAGYAASEKPSVWF